MAQQKAWDRIVAKNKKADDLISVDQEVEKVNQNYASTASMKPLIEEHKSGSSLVK